MDLLHEGEGLLPIITTVPDAAEDSRLMRVIYVRVQPQHPEFTTTYGNVNQTVDIKLSTVVIKADPEDLLSLYDFIMKTFVSTEELRVTESSVTPITSNAAADENSETATLAAPSTDTIRVHLTLASVRSKCLTLGLTRC